MTDSNQVSVYSWHFMPWPYLDDDFDEKYESGWITVPNSLFDRGKMRGLYQEYLDELTEADQLGFDGVVLNEHHQNIYGMMPSPNILMGALTQTTKNCQLVVLGNLLPLHFRPLRVAEEYAMLDCMSNGRVVAGFAPGGGHEAYNYSSSMPLARERFWESVDLIMQAWTKPGPTSFESKHYSMRYVNPWPQPLQLPHPPVWIPGSNSSETLYQVARRGFCYFLSTRTKFTRAREAAKRFRSVVEEVGQTYHPDRIGLLFSVYVAETDEIAQQECGDAVFYFMRNCLKGHLRTRGRRLNNAPGGLTPESYQAFLESERPGAKMLGDAESWDEINEMGSIFAGSPDTVFEKLWQFVEGADIGKLLIQFHIGNLSKEKTLKSQKMFADFVLPRLRSESAKLYAERFPQRAEVNNSA